MDGVSHGWRRGLALLACAVCHGWSWTPAHRMPTRLPPSRFHLKAARSDSNSELRRDRGSGGAAIDDSSARATVPADATVDEGELSDAATGGAFDEDEWAYGDDRSLDREEWEVPAAGGERLRDRPTETQPTRAALACCSKRCRKRHRKHRRRRHKQATPPLPTTATNYQAPTHSQPALRAFWSDECGVGAKTHLDALVKVAIPSPQLYRTASTTSSATSTTSTNSSSSSSTSTSSLPATPPAHLVEACRGQLIIPRPSMALGASRAAHGRYDGAWRVSRISCGHV